MLKSYPAGCKLELRVNSMESRYNGAWWKNPKVAKDYLKKIPKDSGMLVSMLRR